MDLSEVRRPIVAPIRVDPLGVDGPTHAEVRTARWRRTSRTLYVPSEVDGTELDQRIVEAAAVLPRYGAVTGWADLAWRGARWFDGMRGQETLPVALITMRSTIRSQPGIFVSQERITPTDIELQDGVRVARAVAATCFEARYARGPRAAGRVLSMAAYDDLVSLDEVADYSAPYLNGYTGVPQLRVGLGLADENCWSPAEFDMLMTWILDGAHPRPLANHALFDPAGRHLGTPDLIDVEHGVAGDYDSDLHLVDGKRPLVDLDREARFRDHGLEYVTMMRTDRPDTSRFLRRLDGAYHRAMTQHRPRNWSTEAPDWWRFTGTVEARRALDEIDRGHWLRHRSA